jgi:hypothetical protein
MITCPNNAFVVDTPKFYDKGGNQFNLAQDEKISWTPGDTSMASMVVSDDTLSAKIVPLRTTVGDYAYSYSYVCQGNTITVNETVSFENPFPVAAKSDQKISSQTIGE